MILLVKRTQFIGWSFNNINSTIDNSSIEFYQFIIFTFNNCISKAINCTFLVIFGIIDSIDDNINTLTTIWKHKSKAL